MEYRPYKLLGKSELAQIERKLEAAGAVWSAAWLASELPLRTQCLRAAEYRGDASARRDVWLVSGADAGQWVAFSYAPSLNARLGLAMLASGAAGGAPARPSALLNDLVLRAVADLLRPLCPWVAQRAPEKMADGESLPASVWETGSGAAVAQLTCGDDGEHIDVVFSAAHVSALLGPAAAKPAAAVAFARTTDALLKERLQLQVLVGEAQLELGLLQTIAVGDVIKLNTRIDEPLQVLNTDGDRLCSAFLGSVEGRKSIQLIS